MATLRIKFIILILLLSSEAFSQAGVIDSTFGVNGVSLTPLSSTGLATSRTVFALADGKYLVSGYVYVGSVCALGVARFNHDGTLDTQYGTNGLTTTEIVNGLLNYSYTAVLQSDGKLVLGGHTYDGNGTQFVVARYDTSGALDSQFGTGGYTIVSIGSSSIGDYTQGIAIQSTGRIILAGTSYNGSNSDFTMVGFDSNGLVDSTFGIDGSVITAIGSENDNCYSIAIQADDKILLGGDIQNGSTYTFACARYTVNGVLDNSFGTGGIGIFQISTNDDDYGYSIQVQNDGKILFGGTGYNGSDYDFIIFRLDTNGVRDSGFGVNGMATKDFGVGNSDWGRVIRIQSDGKILVAGKTSIIGSAFGIARFDENGIIDNTFGTNGISYIQVANAQHNTYGMTIDLNNEIVICGSAPASTPDNFILVRYHNDLGTGITENGTPASVISIYPNPSTGKFNITSNTIGNDQTLSIVDLSGKIVYTKSFRNSNSTILDLNLSSGMYFVNVKSENSASTTPLIIY